MENDLDGFVPYAQGTRGSGVKNELTGKPGCYIFTDPDNDKLYVGSTTNLATRTNSNLSALKHNKHHNKDLQEVYNRNPNIAMMVKPTNTVEEAQQLEQEVVDKFFPTGKLCNAAVEDVTRSRLGLPVDEEHRKKIGDGNRGKVISNETRLKTSEALLDKPKSEEHKQNLSNTNKAYFSTEEGKADHARRTEKQSHQVICKGVTYPSMIEAARALGINVGSVAHRCNSDKYPDFFKQDKSD